MKKLFVYMLVGAGIFASAAYADGYNPFHPLGGINSATTVPQVYSDGSTGTLAQIGQMADGSVQQTDANQKNGYAKLDGSGNVTAPVSGNIGSAPYFGTQTLENMATFRVNLKERGVLLTPSSGGADETTINNIFTNNTFGYNNGAMAVSIPYGVWPNSSFIPTSNGTTKTVYADKNILNYPKKYFDTYSVPYFGDGVVTIGSNSGNSDGFVVSRVDGNNTNYGMFEPVSQFNLVLDTNKYSASDGYPPPAQNVDTELYATENHLGIAANRWSQIHTKSNSGYDSQLVDGWDKFWIEGDGENWDWNFIHEMIDDSSRNCAALTTSTNTPCVRMNGELDWSGVGPENSDTSYDPGAGMRKALWITGNEDVEGDVSWAASTAYVSHHILSVADSSGQLWMYDSGNGGTSGTTQPTWPYDASTTVTDGTVTWTPLGKWRFDIGSAIGFGGTSTIRFGTLFWMSGPKIYNAIADWSRASFDTATHIITRRPVDSYDDFSADGSAAGQNNRLLGYNSSDTALEYTLSASASGGSAMKAMKISDNGTTTLQGLQFPDQSKTVTSLRGLVQSNSTNNISAIWDGDEGVKILRVYVDDTYIGSVRADGNALVKMSKSAIMALTATDGDTYYDTDDHEQVTYRCPTTTTCGWFPLQYGTALSN